MLGRWSRAGRSHMGICPVHQVHVFCAHEHTRHFTSIVTLHASPGALHPPSCTLLSWSGVILEPMPRNILQRWCECFIPICFLQPWGAPPSLPWSARSIQRSFGKPCPHCTSPALQRRSRTVRKWSRCVDSRPDELCAAALVTV